MLTHVVSGNVAPTGTKALGEGAHHDVNITRVYPPVFRHASPRPPYGTNAVSLVQKEVGLCVCVCYEDQREAIKYQLHAHKRYSSFLCVREGSHMTKRGWGCFL